LKCVHLQRHLKCMHLHGHLKCMHLHGHLKCVHLQRHLKCMHLHGHLKCVHLQGHLKCVHLQRHLKCVHLQRHLKCVLLHAPSHLRSSGLTQHVRGGFGDSDEFLVERGPSLRTLSRGLSRSDAHRLGISFFLFSFIPTQRKKKETPTTPTQLTLFSQYIKIL
jgi:hypothetical protein